MLLDSKKTHISKVILLEMTCENAFSGHYQYSGASVCITYSDTSSENKA